ncbi:MAG: hypothetical protein ACE3JK_08420 [Sporolactobacillus sp.]
MIRPLLSLRSDGSETTAAEWVRRSAGFVGHSARSKLFRRTLHLIPKLVKHDVKLGTRLVRTNWQAFADRLSAIAGLFAGKVTAAKQSAVVPGGTDGSL